MATPTEIVSQFGRSVKLHRPLDDEEITYESPIDILAIVSSPADRSSVEEEGRIEEGERTITVSKDLDVTSNRSGLPDVVEIDGEYFQVEEVINDNHPMADVWKKTIHLGELDKVRHSVLEPEG